MLVILRNQRVDTYMLVGEKTNKDDSGGIGALSISSLEVALLLPLLSEPKRKKKEKIMTFRAIFKAESKAIWDSVGFVLIPFVIGRLNLRLSFNQSDATCNFVICVFPRSRQLTSFYFEFLLVPCVMFIRSDWFFPLTTLNEMRSEITTDAREKREQKR